MLQVVAIDRDLFSKPLKILQYFCNQVPIQKIYRYGIGTEIKFRIE